MISSTQLLAIRLMIFIALTGVSCTLKEPFYQFHLVGHTCSYADSAKMYNVRSIARVISADIIDHS